TAHVLSCVVQLSGCACFGVGSFGVCSDGTVGFDSTQQWHGLMCVAAVRSLAWSVVLFGVFFFSSRRRHTRLVSDWSSDVCSSDLSAMVGVVINGAGSQQSGRHTVELQAVRGCTGHTAATQDRGSAGQGERVPHEIGRASCRERGERSVVAG